MTINLDDYSVAELEKLIKQAERKLEKKRMEAVKSAQAEINKIAKDLGVSVDDLLEEKSKSRKKTTARKATRKKKPRCANRPRSNTAIPRTALKPGPAVANVRCGCATPWKKAPSWKISKFKPQGSFGGRNRTRLHRRRLSPFLPFSPPQISRLDT